MWDGTVQHGLAGHLHGYTDTVNEMCGLIQPRRNLFIPFESKWMVEWWYDPVSREKVAQELLSMLYAVYHFERSEAYEQAFRLIMLAASDRTNNLNELLYMLRDLSETSLLQLRAPHLPSTTVAHVYDADEFETFFQKRVAFDTGTTFVSTPTR